MTVRGSTGGSCGQAHAKNAVTVACHCERQAHPRGQAIDCAVWRKDIKMGQEKQPHESTLMVKELNITGMSIQDSADLKSGKYRSINEVQIHQL
jgi:hypothetical protein